MKKLAKLSLNYHQIRTLFLLLALSLHAGHDDLPTSSLFLSSIDRFLNAVAAAPTTRSTSYVNRSTRLGKPFSFLTKALVSTAN